MIAFSLALQVLAVPAPDRGRISCRGVLLPGKQDIPDAVAMDYFYLCDVYQLPGIRSVE